MGKLYEIDINFKNWCDLNLWIQEVLYLITQKAEISAKEVANSYKAIEEIYLQSKSFTQQRNFFEEIKSVIIFLICPIPVKIFSQSRF